ncbi:MAG TPA: radical SAM protein [Pyrinomonadaceae bacterium]|nr:radical SAM protein [Pyrinomonadaceae bacterium]
MRVELDLRKNSRVNLPRKRVLVVNCYFDDSRQPLRRTTKVPQAVGPIYLAGAFSQELCDVKCYTEVASGPLEDERLLSWPDVLVLTGLTNSFDRMLHLTAYARTKNPKVIVIAGGPTVRALPLLSRKVFDYTCLGDIEELCEVIAEALGSEYVAETMMPRYDLAYWLNRIGYVETTRYCNFRCSFCSLTAEGHAYQTYDLDYIRGQILASGKRRRMFFLDNNFYGSDRSHFYARVKLINEMRLAGHYRKWGALVTNDFYSRDENLKLVNEAGCELLFSGLESFDNDWLRNFNKLQNTKAPQVEMISKSLNAGVVFYYGLMVDVTTRSVADLRRELNFITGTPEITIPAFVTLSIPLLGTPYFYECLRNRSLLPDMKLRDMDGTTILQKPVDPIGEVVKFIDDLQSLRGFQGRVLKHAVGFSRLYRSKLTKMQMILALGNGLLVCAQPFTTSFATGGWIKKRPRPRTYISTTEPLDHMYTPAFRVDSRFESYFKPTMITDKQGELHEDILNSGLLRNATAPASAVARAV